MHFDNMPIRKSVYHRHTPYHVIVHIHKNMFDHTLYLNAVKLAPERVNAPTIGHNLKLAVSCIFQSMMYFDDTPIRKSVYHRHTPYHVIVHIHKNMFDHTLYLNAVKLAPERVNAPTIGHNLKLAVSCIFQSMMYFDDTPIRKSVYHRHTPYHVIVHIHKNMFDHTLYLNAVKLAPERVNAPTIGHNLKLVCVLYSKA